ncbi:hypothetical protein EGW08_016949 [Elysia chlorotica]|uniref:EGF-like domain-containing protein n=1 Tax=Elysia chlorotica TaxID=188477 RepID=A0A433T151_ELYCH|nr:hypothetical protein EGW08_016949 [Elysia chlorotica]
MLSRKRFTRLRNCAERSGLLSQSVTLIQPKMPYRHLWPCVPGTYGRGCKYPCSAHCKHGNCDRVNGTCLHGCNPGYQPPLCIDVCSPPTYGSNCRHKCSPYCPGPSCHPVTGVCNLCKPGSRGEGCLRDCPLGTFGPSCLMFCADHCDGLHDCDRVNGLCSPCPPGSRGRFCSRGCTHGKYGIGCSEFCSDFCRGNGTCNSATGACPAGCEGNLVPPLCKTGAISMALVCCVIASTYCTGDRVNERVGSKYDLEWRSNSTHTMDQGDHRKGSKATSGGFTFNQQFEDEQEGDDVDEFAENNENLEDEEYRQSRVQFESKSRRNRYSGASSAFTASTIGSDVTDVD